VANIVSFGQDWFGALVLLPDSLAGGGSRTSGKVPPGARVFSQQLEQPGEQLWNRTEGRV
jgi:hypothetical protein